jgi:pyrroline-5-carboxylate reductase
LSKKIGIIGYGNMGSAIAEAIKTEYQVFVFDQDKKKTKDLIDINVADSIHNLAQQSDAIILAVKPQDFDLVLSDIKDAVRGQLIISIAAGITTSYIEKYLGKVRIIRVMPNIGAKISQAETCIARGTSATDEDLSFAEVLFGMIGKTWKIGEDMMDAATAITGSGPAYILYDVEREGLEPGCILEQHKQNYTRLLKDAAVELGFSVAVAADLASCVTSSTTNLMSLTQIPPSELRKQVTSKGGTTEAALHVLMGGGSWLEAAKAAKERAKQLSRKD